jgi:hypothetical protein
LVSTPLGKRLVFKSRRSRMITLSWILGWEAGGNVSDRHWWRGLVLQEPILRLLCNVSSVV